MSMKKQIDDAIDLAINDQGSIPVTIKLTLEEGDQFRREIEKETKFVGEMVRYKGIPIVEGYRFIMENNTVFSGLVCVCIFNDYGTHYIRQHLIKWSGEMIV